MYLDWFIGKRNYLFPMILINGLGIQSTMRKARQIQIQNWEKLFSHGVLKKNLDLPSKSQRMMIFLCSFS